MRGQTLICEFVWVFRRNVCPLSVCPEEEAPKNDRLYLDREAGTPCYLLHILQVDKDRIKYLRYDGHVGMDSEKERSTVCWPGLSRDYYQNKETTGKPRAIRST